MVVFPPCMAKYTFLARFPSFPPDRRSLDTTIKPKPIFPKRNMEHGIREPTRIPQQQQKQQQLQLQRQRQHQPQLKVVPEALPIVGDPEDQGWRPDPDGAASSLWVARADLRVHRGGRDGGSVPPAGDHGVAHNLFVDDSGQEFPPGHGRLDSRFLYGESAGGQL